MALSVAALLRRRRRRGGGAAFSVSITGLTGGEARPGDHASISYTTDPVSATETVKWSDSSNPADAATYGTGSSPTDYTAGDGGNLWLHVTDGGETVSRSAPIRYAPGTASAIADGQTATVDDTVLSIAATATGANLTFTYSLLNAPAGMTTNASTGGIGGTVTEVFSGTVTLRATDQYGRNYDDTFTFTSSLRAQATAADGLGPFVFSDGSAISNQDLSADFTANGNTLTYTISPALPSGLSLASNGILSGTPSVEAAEATYTVTGQDEYGRETTSQFLLTVTGEVALFLVAGQSNVIGRATFDGGTTHPAQVFQWTQAGAEGAPTNPLDHPGRLAGDMGLDITFAQDYIAANPTHKLVFIPEGTGGSGFSNNNWNPGDTLYNNAVAAANAAIVHYGVSSLKGILWHQGETDAIAGYTESQYGTALQNMALAMRSAITGSTNVPFIAGEILSTVSGSTAVNAAINDIQNLIGYSAAVEASELADDGDNLHFSAAALRTLGTRYHTALASANSLLPATVFVAPTISGTAQVGQTLTATAGKAGPHPITTDWQWKRAGVDISGAESSDYTIVEADLGSTLTVEQNSTNASGSVNSLESIATATVVAASSSAIADAVSASTSSAFWAPTDDASILFQNSDMTTAVTNGDPVGGINVQVGNVDVIQPTSGNRGVWNETDGLITMDGTTQALEMSMTTAGGDMYFACVYKGTDDRLALLGRADGTNYIGRAMDNQPSLPITGESTVPTLIVDGVEVSPANADTFHIAISDGNKHIIEIVGMDLSNIIWQGSTNVMQIGKIFTGGTGGDHINGDIGDFVMCDTPDATARGNIRAELAARHGITL